MAQQDYSGLIAVGVIGAAAWYAYEQGWFSSLLGTTTTPATGSAASLPAGVTPISTNVMTMAGQIAYAAQLQAAGYSIATINTLFAALAQQMANCVSPSQWTTLTSFANTDNHGCNNPSGLPASSAPPTSTSTPTQPVPVVADPVATSNLVALLLNASGGASRLTIDGWAYYYNALPGKVPITADQMSAMIAANGQITDANRSTYNITPDAFVALLNGQGLSGLGFYAGIPFGAIHGGGW